MTFTQIWLYLCLLPLVQVLSSGCPFQGLNKLPSDQVKKGSKPHEPNYRDLLKNGRQVSPRSFEMSRRNNFFDSKVQRLIQKGVAKTEAVKRVNCLLEELQMEVDICKKALPECDPYSKYRTVNGQCNNIDNPFYGSQGYQLHRLLPPKYEDKESNPTANSKFKAREGCTPSGPLPNARLVSQTVHNDVDISSPIATSMIAQWGMFAAHDLSFVPSSHGSQCCKGSEDKSCFPINILSNDPFYSKFNVTCLNFYRSVRYCSSSPREQFNDITSFIDASNVYGSNEEQLAALREPGSYLMKASLTPSGRELLPTDQNGTYIAGDARALLVSGLTSVHTLFVREHNRLARILSKKYPSQTNETTFNETRRIIGSIMQNIIYGEFLTLLLGEETMEDFKLSLKYPSSYDSEMNPTVASAFVAAAYRFGHSMIQKYVSRSAIDEYGVNYTYPLLDDFFEPKNYEDNNGTGMDEIINGLASFPAQAADRFVVKEVTNHLFNNGKPYGTDLETKTILRGRDHGLPTYGDWRELCGLQALCTWKDKPAEISPDSWAKLKKLYASPNDIDLHTAGLAESPIPGTILGPTNNCIIAHQFKALKDGDRFFFTHKDEAGSFSESQVQSLFHVTLSRIICDNTGIKFINENVFRRDSKIVSCSELPRLNIDLF